MLALLAAAALGAPGSIGVPPPQAADALRPPIVQRPIPFGPARRRETAAYARRHYGLDTFRLRDPRVIVEHLTVNDSIAATYAAFAPDRPDVELHELPGVCSHFVVGKNGRIHRTVRPAIRCRHTIGLNYTAIGVEMVQETGRGSHWADRQILHRRRQIHRALRLVGWLKQRYGIRMRDIVGHAMANDSPYFKDLEGWRNDHNDWLRRDVRKFHHRLHRMLHG
jgi:N-acetylmuramoyl-L-alanine amidase